MERGQIGGLNYRMTFPPRQGGYAGGMGTDDGGEEINYQQPALPKNPIAHREKLTSDYFNNYNLLKSFTLDLAKKGIDASDPYQDPEAFKVFQKLQAGLMLAANALEREGQAEDQMRPYIAQDKVRVSQNADRNGLYAQDPTSYYSTELTPGAQEVNYRLRQETNDPQSEARLNQLMQFEGQKIDQQVSRGEISPERGQYLKSQLVPNKWRTQVFSPNSGRGAGGDGKYDYQVALLRKYTNLKNGVWSPETYQKTTVNGKVFLKNEDGKGDVLGKYNARPDKNGNPILKDKVVDSWLKDPITGKVYIKYTDPEIPMEEVSNQPGDAVTRSFVSNNSKYGSVDKIMEAATATGLINEQGSSIDQMLMPQNYQDIQSQVRQAGASTAADVEQKRTNLKNQLKAVTDPTFIGHNGIDYELPDGRKVLVRKHRGKDQYYISNYKDLGYDKEPENLSLDDVFNILDQDFQYFSKFLNQEQKSLTVNKGGKKIW